MVPTRAGEHINLMVSPTVAWEPGYVTVRASIDAADTHRSMEIVAESDDYYRSSVVQLDGDQAPRTTQVLFRNLPGGEYTVSVTVRGARGEALVRSERTARIVSRGGM